MNSQRRWSSVLVAFGILSALCVAGSPVADAWEGADPDSYREYDIGDGSVTLDVQDAPFGQVVRERIQPRTRVNIIVAPEAEDQLVTLRVVDLHWVQTLDAMAEKIGGVLIRRAPNLLRIERPEPVSIQFTDEDVVKVIDAIAQYGSASVIIQENVAGKITLTLNQTPWREALEQVVRTAGFALVEEDYGVLRVVPITMLDLETGYYRFRYLRPPAPYKGVIASQTGGSGSSSGGSGGGSGGGSNQGADIVQSNVYVPTDNPADIEENFPILAALRQIVEPEQGDVRYIAQQNTLLFTGTRPKIQALRALLGELDVEPPQVFIDMNFIITQNRDALDIGMSGGQNGLAAGFTGADILHMLPFNAGGSGSDLASAITGTPFTPPTSSSFSYGTLNFSQTSLLFRALQRDTSTQIVQAPKILALDNQEATIFIGESVRYARSEAATNQNGGLQFSIEEDQNSPVNVGFQLLVIPNVILGENKIMMTVIPQRRALNGTSSPVIGFDRFEVSGQTIDLPRVQTAALKTAMILADGQTAVIGGLLEDNVRKGVDKVPLLGDIPILGLAFVGKSNTVEKSHLMITITPRILRGTDAANCTISSELGGRTQTVDAEWADIAGESVQNFPLAPCEPRYSAPTCGPSGTVPPPPPPPGLPVAPSR